MSYPTPWIGLVAIVAMFVLPLLPARLFEGPRTIKRYPRRVVCGDCGERWTDEHTCALEVARAQPQRRPRLRADLNRIRPGRALARRSTNSSAIRRFRDSALSAIVVLNASWKFMPHG